MLEKSYSRNAPPIIVNTLRMCQQRKRTLILTWKNGLKVKATGFPLAIIPSGFTVKETIRLFTLADLGNDINNKSTDEY